jgi:hypothetical protein
MTQLFSNTASWIQFGCIDFVHNARTLAYHLNACANDLYDVDPQITVGGACWCPADGDPGDFVDPATDEVCWYDPLIPESEQFLGVLVNDVGANGLVGSGFVRDSVDAVGGGSVLQIGFKPGREQVFDIVLLATTCAGMEYGINWLQRVLERNGCRQGPGCRTCTGQCMTIRVNCDDESSASGLRTWYSAGLRAGLQLDDEQIDRKCCQIQTGQIVIGTESSKSFDEDVEHCEIIADEEAFNACIEWRSFCVNCQTEPCLQCRNCNTQLDACESCIEKCGPCSNCFGDPLCDNSLRLIRPTPVVDECFCEPIEKVIQCCEIPDIPNGYDTTLSIELYSGFDLSNPDYGLRNVRIKVFQNPQGLPPITDQASYDLWKGRKPCSILELSYVPPDSYLLIDGRLQQVFLKCENICKPFNHVASSPLGGSIFPLVANCHDLLVCVEWDRSQTAFLVSGGVYGTAVYGGAEYGAVSSVSGSAARLRVITNRTWE